jgi:WD40 repeat protein
VFEGHESIVQDIAAPSALGEGQAPDVFATCSDDGSIRIWSLTAALSDPAASEGE